MRSPWRVFIAEPAKADILGAAEYISRTLCNPPAAQRLLDDLEAAIRSLSSHPARHREVPVSPWRERGYHGFFIRNHLILYRIDARGRTIHVARVFHATQDWVSRLDSLR